MKQIQKTCCLLVLMLGGLNAQAAIDSEGYYYAAYYISEPESKFLVGAYATKEKCLKARFDDYDPANYRLPWDGGGRCNYISDRDIDNANELYGISQPYIQVIMAEKTPSEIATFLADVHALESAYNLQQFKQDLQLLIQHTVNQ